MRCVRWRWRAYARACVRACVRARVCVCVCYVYACVRVRACVRISGLAATLSPGSSSCLTTARSLWLFHEARARAATKGDLQQKRGGHGPRNGGERAQHWVRETVVPADLGANVTCRQLETCRRLPRAARRCRRSCGTVGAAEAAARPSRTAQWWQGGGARHEGARCLEGRERRWQWKQACRPCRGGGVACG